jgi:hypothetical protein
MYVSNFNVTYFILILQNSGFISIQDFAHVKEMHSVQDIFLRCFYFMWVIWQPTLSVYLSFPTGPHPLFIEILSVHSPKMFIPSHSVIC